MDLMRARVAIRERRFVDVFDLAIRFCAANARAYGVLALVVIAPAFAVSWGAARLGGWALGWSVAVLLACVADVPFLTLASRLLFEDGVRTGDVVRQAVRAAPRVVLARAVKGFTLLASAALLGLPWLYLGPALLFLVEVTVLERATVDRAVVRAQKIALAHFGTAIAAMMVLDAIRFGAPVLFDVAGRELLERGLELRPPPSMWKVGGSWLALAGWWALVPLSATARFFMYLDCRTRSEGWDIQTRFAALAARIAQDDAPAPAPADGPRDASKGARWMAGAAIVVFALSAASPARAALDPSRAEADRSAALGEKPYSFCANPRLPLSSRARALCPHASAIAGCEGFAAACAANADALGQCGSKPPKTTAWSRWDWPWLRHLAAAIAWIAKGAIWVLVAAVAIAVFGPLLAMILRARRDRAIFNVAPAPAAGGASPDPGPDLPDDEDALLRVADLSAFRGENAAALQLYLAASLRSLDRRGAIRVGRGRTNGEYVRACREAILREPLSAIVREVERVQFGRQEATLEAVAAVGRRAHAIVKAAVAMTALVVLLAGCASDDPCRRAPVAGDDPAGLELFGATLRRQGVAVEPLGQSLTSLDVDAAKASPRSAVVVDLRETPLDEDVQKHLVEWVSAGGLLVLAGEPGEWPADLAATPARGEGACRVTIGSPTDDDEDDDVPADSAPRPEPAPKELPVALAVDAGFESPDEAPIAAYTDGVAYAGWLHHGRGYVLAIASDEILTNAGLARPGNAAAMVAIFGPTMATKLRLAERDDGVAPPSAPWTSLARAGLGLGMLHGLFALALLFLAAGVRLARPRPAAPARRRAFTEHVRAVGALYARAGGAAHALAAYVRFAEERLRARMPRGGSDVAAFLAARTGEPVERCRAVWARAMSAGERDDLLALRELSVLTDRALAPEK